MILNNEGVIIKSSGGFYTVETEDGETECRARGILRKDNTKPYVGDRVVISKNEDGSGNVDDILPRKNSLIRPPLANLDAIVLALSVSDPDPNLFVTDKFIAVLEHKGIEPLIAVTKLDLQDASGLVRLYSGAGFPVFPVSCETGEGLDPLKRALAGKFLAFSGNSGVGKSSLLNAIDPRLGLEVGETSKKLGRGRHTTRTIQVFTLENGARIADTPGFSSIDLVQMSDVDKSGLAGCFREFAPYTGKCRFDDCTHTVEAGCEVLEAVKDGSVASSRHENYCQMFAQIKDIKDWQRHQLEAGHKTRP